MSRLDGFAPFASIGAGTVAGAAVWMGDVTGADAVLCLAYMMLGMILGTARMIVDRKRPRTAANFAIGTLFAGFAAVGSGWTMYLEGWSVMLHLPAAMATAIIAEDIFFGLINEGPSFVTGAIKGIGDALGRMMGGGK